MWSGYTDNIPRTKQDEALAGLALAYPLEVDGSDGVSQSQEKTNSNTTGAGGTPSRDQDTDVASLDDLLDTSGSEAGSQSASSPASSQPSV